MQHEKSVYDFAVQNWDSLKQKQCNNSSNDSNEGKDHSDYREYFQHSSEYTRWLTVLKPWADILHKNEIKNTSKFIPSQFMTILIMHFHTSA